ncbi:hypothetical protein AC1031_014018 [Aphanomyces cochlioides]|nr:hypothetical protein AC1031_014018 [Aphanomyces cochlioides]
MLVLTTKAFGDLMNKHVNLLGSSKEEHLLEAAKEADIKRLRPLLARGAVVNYKDKHDRTLSHGADIDLTNKELLPHGADITDAVGLIPLLWASHWGHFDVVIELLAHGASIDKASEKGNTAILFALENRSWAQLLAHGARVDLADKHGTTSLHLAASDAHAGVVKSLLAYNASVNAVNKVGETPLHQASKNVKVQFAKGNDPTADMTNNMENVHSPGTLVNDQLEVLQLPWCQSTAEE